MSVWERVRMSGAAALSAWRDFGSEPELEQANRYELLYSWWAGTWRADPAIRSQRTTAPRLYKNSRQLWRQADAVVSLYEQFVYAGDLSTDGQPLPDGTRGAIPIDPQTGSAQTNAALLAAFAELFSLWRWRQHMTLRPRMAAILGDCLTELVDDPAKGVVLPRLVWPGYVVDLELDLVGNVKRYAVQYRVEQPESTAYGRRQQAERYVFRKEVDGEAFRFYKDGRPFAYPEIGDAVQPNPYGFAPAIWDRHEIVWGDRGMSAIERTLQQTLELNSVLSHAMDYQRKQFAAPVGVKGSALGTRRGPLAMPGGASATDLPGDPERAAETLNLLPMQDDGGFVTVSFDVGKTRDMLGLVMDSILAESPEARYAQQLLEMTQVTAPGAERLLAPIVGKVKRARSNHDPQTVKLLQMATAMLGERLRRGDVPAAVRAARPARYAAFATFDLSSYGRGALDCSIPDRPVFMSTFMERVQELIAVEAIQSPALLRRAGLPEEVVQSIVRDRAARSDALDSAITGIDYPDERSGSSEE